MKNKEKASQSELIRRMLYQNPGLSFDEIAESLEINKKNVQINVGRDLKNGKCIKTDNGYDYSGYFFNVEEKAELREWSNIIRRELVEQLLEANKSEIDSNQIRLNAKEINRLLKEITH